MYAFRVHVIYNKISFQNQSIHLFYITNKYLRYLWYLTRRIYPILSSKFVTSQLVIQFSNKSLAPSLFKLSEFQLLRFNEIIEAFKPSFMQEGEWIQAMKQTIYPIMFRLLHDRFKWKQMLTFTYHWGSTGYLHTYVPSLITRRTVILQRKFLRAVHKYLCQKPTACWIVKTATTFTIAPHKVVSLWRFSLWRLGVLYRDYYGPIIVLHAHMNSEVCFSFLFIISKYILVF